MGSVNSRSRPIGDIDTVELDSPKLPVAYMPRHPKEAPRRRWPLFTDQQFHNTGVPPRDAASRDRGRAAATVKVRGHEFNCLGLFSDARPAQCQELRFMVSDDPALEGAFKTPGLRGVAQRPPYMHAEQIATLDHVVRHYVEAPHAKVGHSELTHKHAGKTGSAHAERAPIELTDAEVSDLVRFLGTLDMDRQPAVAAR